MYTANFKICMWFPHLISRQLPRSKGAVHLFAFSCKRKKGDSIVNRSNKFQNKESSTFQKMKSEWRNQGETRKCPESSNLAVCIHAAPVP